ncbi:MAG: hypothetical protein IPI58_07725 [Alphaproteobacteria bacterium]|nr:MAG: hypothetical protein IPI58_07725 [Alphaproteobacteria bacterium]
MINATLLIIILAAIATGAVAGVALMMHLQRRAMAHVLSDMAQAVKNQGESLHKVAQGLEAMHGNHGHLQEQVKTLSQIVLKQKKELDTLRHVVLDEEVSRPHMALLN